MKMGNPKIATSSYSVDFEARPNGSEDRYSASRTDPKMGRVCMGHLGALTTPAMASIQTSCSCPHVRFG